MDKPQMICKGRPQPSKEALDSFIEVYTKAIKEIEKKEGKEKE